MSFASMHNDYLDPERHDGPKEKFQLFKGPKSPTRLRELRNAIMRETANEKGCVTHEVTIHFFQDCWLGYHGKSNHGRFVEFTAKIITKDYGKTWKPYHDDYEPAEGFHRAVQYSPSNSDFPTKEW